MVLLCLMGNHRHPVGTTDVQMMSCRKGIGREGGATGAREDSGQAEPRCETGKRGITGLWLSSIALQSRNYSQDVTQCSSDSEALQHFGEGDKSGVPSKERKGKGEG
ncbi:hypothetical protein JOQ06_003885, partial [Pogonophryne albipinna]